MGVTPMRLNKLLLGVLLVLSMALGTSTLHAQNTVDVTAGGSITVDRNHMIQAFLNVGRNAMQALGQSGRLIFRTRALTNFTVGGERHRLVLSAEVEDNGPGIPAELKETIFYPLVTGRPTGTGLGLTIAQDLVSRNGGLIEFVSEPGRTVFQIRLPVVSGGRH